MTATQTVPRTQLERLRSSLRGEVHTPEDEAYAAARRAWNLTAQHKPAAVVMAEHTDDVVEAIRFARSAGLGVGVMATGHGTTRSSDGGLLVNTSRMRGVSVDPVRRRARVEAGAVWSDVIAATARHGLTGLPGSAPGVGVVGFTLGGGFGWLGRRYGLAAHSVTRAQVALADGRLLLVGPDDHADLFWGLTGGTDNFGIVTSLEFGLHPVTDVYGGNLYYPLDRAEELLGFFAEWTLAAPPDLTSAATFRSFPDLPVVPHPLRGRSLIALRGVFCGDVCTGEALFDQARSSLGPAALDTFARTPVSSLAGISLDPVEPMAFVGHTELISELSPGLVETLVERAGPAASSPLVMLELRQLGGALAGPAGSLSPMAHTAAAYSLNGVGVAPTPERRGALRAHLRELAGAVRPYTTGETYLNFLDLDGATPQRVRAAYTAGDWAALVQLKDRYDPGNLFRFNRNIPPTEGELHS